MKSLLIPAIFTTAFLSAQTPPEIEWSKSLGGLSADIPYEVIISNTGKFVIAGQSNSTGVDITGHHGSDDYSDAWIVKINETDGSIVWQNSIGGSDDDAAYSIKQTNDNGYIVCGYAISDNGDVSGNHGFVDYWLVKLNGSGNIQWQKCYGGISSDNGVNVIQTADSGYFISGSAYSLDGDVTGVHGSNDYWVVKTNDIGDIEWQKCYGGTGYDYLRYAEQTTDGGFMLSGYSNSTDGDISFNHGNYDYWLVKIDSSGNMEWEKSYGGSFMEQDAIAKQTADNEIIIIGSTESDDGDVSFNHGTRDFWIIKTDIDGDIIWEKCFGGTYNEFALDVSINNDGTFAIAGRSESTDGDLTEHFGVSYWPDFWVIEIDADGNLLWQKIYGGSNFDVATSIKQTSDNGFIVCGSSVSTDHDVTDHLDPGIFADYWVIKLSCEEQIYFADADDDGYGDPTSFISNCTLPPGFVSDSTDCDDANAEIHTGVAEICNSLDDNCNGLTDEDVFVFTLYQDFDGDGFGNALIDSLSCIPDIDGYVFDNTDCDDTDENIYPGAPELPDGLDNNCNDTIDEGFNAIELNEIINCVVFPNPATDQLFVQFDHPCEKGISIFNSLGGLMIQLNSNQLLTPIETTYFPAGIYVMRISCNGYQTAVQFAVE